MEETNQNAVEETPVVEETVQEPQITDDDVKVEPTVDVPEVKTYTEDEVMKMIQAQTDKRVTEALKTAKGKWQSEYEEQLAKEKAEAERLAKLSAEERQKEELRKIQEGIDIERAEFEQQRAEFQRERLTLDTIKKLSASGMPPEFADFLVAKTEEVTAKNLETFTNIWNAQLQNAIEKHVENRLRGQEPQASNNTSNTKLMSRKEFANLPAKERMLMMEENPDLVKEILAQK